MRKVLITTFIYLSLSQAYAADVGFIIPGSKPGSTSGIVNITSGDTFTTRVPPDRSVYCRYRSTVANDWALSNILTCDFFTPCPTPNLVGGAESGIDSIYGADDAIAFISDEVAAETLDHYRYKINIVAISGGTNNAAIECFDTTLYGNFNTVTAANPFNFLELSNDSFENLTARIVVTKNDGTLLSRININVSAGQQRDISIHDIAGAANTFGRITVASNGGLHALRAKLTKYTSSFLITASDKLETRGNEE